MPRSLIASLELSLERLSERERHAVRRLDVFQGGAFEDDLLAITGLGDSDQREQLQTPLAALESGERPLVVAERAAQRPGAVERVDPGLVIGAGARRGRLEISRRARPVAGPRPRVAAQEEAPVIERVGPGGEIIGGELRNERGELFRAAHDLEACEPADRPVLDPVGERERPRHITLPAERARRPGQAFGARRRGRRGFGQREERRVRAGMVDRVIVSAPPESIHDAIRIVAYGGVITFFGLHFGGRNTIPVDINDLIFRKITLCPFFAEPAVNFNVSLSLLRDGLVPAADLVTHTFLPQDARDVFGAIIERSQPIIKAVMLPNGSSPGRRGFRAAFRDDGETMPETSHAQR